MSFGAAQKWKQSPFEQHTSNLSDNWVPKLASSYKVNMLLGTINSL